MASYLPLKPVFRAVLFAIRELAGDGRSTEAKVASIAHIAGVGEASVYRALPVLILGGYVRSERKSRTCRVLTVPELPMLPFARDLSPQPPRPSATA